MITGYKKYKKVEQAYVGIQLFTMSLRLKYKLPVPIIFYLLEFYENAECYQSINKAHCVQTWRIVWGCGR